MHFRAGSEVKGIGSNAGKLFQRKVHAKSKIVIMNHHVVISTVSSTWKERYFSWDSPSLAVDKKYIHMGIIARYHVNGYYIGTEMYYIDFPEKEYKENPAELRRQLLRDRPWKYHPPRASNTIFKLNETSLVEFHDDAGILKWLGQDFPVKEFLETKKLQYA